MKIKSLFLTTLLMFILGGTASTLQGCNKDPGSSSNAESTQSESDATSRTSAGAEQGMKTIDPKYADLKSNPNPSLSVDKKTGLTQATAAIHTDKGVIKYKFYANDAPKTTQRIIELIQKGFYDGLVFHRVVPGFVIQGGDPVGNGTGGSGQNLKAEFNSRKHIAGTVAMARARDPDSADSQFYISLGTHPHLDNQYTVFGFVVEGMDVAQKIAPNDKMHRVVIE